jgi:hypothetical protein
MVIVADDTEAAAWRFERVHWNDPAIGVMRQADAGYEIAIACARKNGSTCLDCERRGARHAVSRRGRDGARERCERLPHGEQGLARDHSAPIVAIDVEGLGDLALDRTGLRPVRIRVGVEPGV